MAEKKNKKSNENSGKEKEEKSLEEVKREYALKNLNSSNLMDVAATYFAHKRDGVCGKLDISAIDKYKYLPVFSSGVKAYNDKGEEYDIIQKSISDSRVDEEIGTGNVSEMKIMKDCAEVMQNALNDIKIGELMKLMGSDAKLKGQFNDKYVGSLMPKFSREELEKLSQEQKEGIQAGMEIYHKLVGDYTSYLIQTKLIEAFTESKKQIPKGLEALLAEPEKDGGK